MSPERAHDDFSPLEKWDEQKEMLFSIGKNPPFVKGNMLGFQGCIVDRLAMITSFQEIPTYANKTFVYVQVCTNTFWSLTRDNYILESDMDMSLHNGA